MKIMSNSADKESVAGSVIKAAGTMDFEEKAKHFPKS